MAILQNPALLWELIFGRPSVGKSTLLLKWQFHRFLLWLFIFLSYSESSRFGRPGLGTSTPLSNGNSIDSFFDCWYFFPTLRVHIWQTNCWQIYPLSNGNFTDSCSDCSYFFPTLRAQHLADLVWQISPLSNGNFTDSCSTLRAHIWQTKC